MFSIEEYQKLPIKRSVSWSVQGAVNRAAYRKGDNTVYWAVNRTVYDVVFGVKVHAVGGAFVKGFQDV